MADDKKKDKPIIADKLSTKFWWIPVLIVAVAAIGWAAFNLPEWKIASSKPAESKISCFQAPSDFQELRFKKTTCWLIQLSGENKQTGWVVTPESGEVKWRFDSVTPDTRYWVEFRGGPEIYSDPTIEQKFGVRRGIFRFRGVGLVRALVSAPE